MLAKTGPGKRVRSGSCRVREESSGEVELSFLGRIARLTSPLDKIHPFAINPPLYMAVTFEAILHF